MIVLETERLVLRRISTHDAEFILRLLNEPSFLRYIGDRGVRTLEDAQAYISKGPIDSYDRHGFGLFLVSRKHDGVPIGMCGLLKRDALREVDVGFAFLPEFWGHGYAFEAASAVLSYGREVLGLGRIVAITSPDNEGSMRVLTKLGMRFEGMIRLADSEPEVRLFA